MGWFSSLFGSKTPTIPKAEREARNRASFWESMGGKPRAQQPAKGSPDAFWEGLTERVHFPVGVGARINPERSAISSNAFWDQLESHVRDKPVATKPASVGSDAFWDELIDHVRDEEPVAPPSDRKLDEEGTAAFLLGAWIDVESSNVAAIKYDIESSVLWIRFHNGGVYSYKDISLQEAEDFAKSPSKGGSVWDKLREHGTVFGWKKIYTYSEALSDGYEPVWHTEAEWRAAHGNPSHLPPGGERDDPSIIQEPWYPHGPNWLKRP